MVKLGSWAAARHQRYVKFVGRVQKYIATIVLAEKEERSKRKKVEKVEKGYDPECWVETNGRIRNKAEESCMFVKVQMPPPKRGFHKWAKHGKMYKDVQR